MRFSGSAVNKIDRKIKILVRKIPHGYVIHQALQTCFYTPKKKIMGFVTKVYNSGFFSGIESTSR